jgi:prepilin-type N-terminal cleavage/methylation domain-containing protein
VRHQKSFTLVELIIVVGLVVILATFGVMNFVNYRNRQKLNLTSQEISVILRNAQDRSITQESGRPWGVYFANPSGNNNDFYELFSGASYPGTTVSRNALSSSIQFDLPAAGSNSIVIFAPISGLPDSPITVKISLVNDPSASSTIIVNSNGQIQY